MTPGTPISTPLGPPAALGIAAPLPPHVRTLVLQWVAPSTLHTLRHDSGKTYVGASDRVVNKFVTTTLPWRLLDITLTTVALGVGLVCDFWILVILALMFGSA